jgi:DNA polymerase III subunit epsilon
VRLVAIDFETADRLPDSACAVGLAVVEDGRLADVRHALIRPPRKRFEFTYLHGICWEDVALQPEFGAVWDQLAPLTAGAQFLLAHNAPFDRRVLAACCESSGRPMPLAPFVCTVRLAREAWNIRPTNLPNVCRHIGIPLDHHNAESDALACAQIAIAVLRQGGKLDVSVVGNRRSTSKRRAAAPPSPPAQRRPVSEANVPGHSGAAASDPDATPRPPSKAPTAAEARNGGSNVWIWLALAAAGLALLIAAG